MDNNHTYAVTLVRADPGRLPVIEVGAYRYTADQLPRVGETIAINSVAALEERRGYVTRIRPASDSPISALEVAGGESDSPTDDYLA